MNVLIVLIVSFGIAAGLFKMTGGNYRFVKAGSIAMSAMLLFTSMGHFLYAKGMSMMLPEFFPLKIELVYFTGILEIAAAIGLQITKFRRLTALLLVVFFVAILPANIQASLNHIDIYEANNQGPGVDYLWFRVPLQLFLIAWAYGLFMNQTKWI